MFDGLRQGSLGVAVVIVVVASSLPLAAGCASFALTSATAGVEALADGEAPSKFIMVDYSASYEPKVGEFFNARPGFIYLVLRPPNREPRLRFFQPQPDVLERRHRRRGIPVGDNPSR